MDVYRTEEIIEERQSCVKVSDGTYCDPFIPLLSSPLLVRSFFAEADNFILHRQRVKFDNVAGHRLHVRGLLGQF